MPELPCSSCSPTASSANFLSTPCRDDIDAFVLQVEGSKRWRLYAHTDPQHVLPRCAAPLAVLVVLPGTCSFLACTQSRMCAPCIHPHTDLCW